MSCSVRKVEQSASSRRLGMPGSSPAGSSSATGSFTLPLHACTYATFTEQACVKKAAHEAPCRRATLGTHSRNASYTTTRTGRPWDVSEPMSSSSVCDPVDSSLSSLHIADLVVAVYVASIGEGGDGGAGHCQGASDAAVAGEPLAELEERVDVALGWVRDQEHVNEPAVRAGHGVAYLLLSVSLALVSRNNCATNRWASRNINIAKKDANGLLPLAPSPWD
ncbi:LOW QUALITY PROTEIN: hypothetical protein U9M48_008810, partial [Paspalum notatum var. saurae]